ncbi:hypothetical protein ACIPR8_15700 [Stenotrophomonas sp. LARHCG68]
MVIEENMKLSGRSFVAVVVFFAVLAAEVLLTLHFLPDYSNKQIHDFMLISMGLAFIPLFALAIAAMALLGLFVAIALTVSYLFVPKKKTTIGEIAARKDRDRRY